MATRARRHAAAKALRPPRDDGSAVAVLVIDMINEWRDGDGDALSRSALAIAPRIVALCTRARAQGVAVIRVNDNFGQWRSSMADVHRRAAAAGPRARRIATMMTPHPDDYIVLKPTQSAFHATPLHLLLQHLGTHTVVLVGVAADQCILASAVDAHVHGYRPVVPRDAIAGASRAAITATVAHFDRLCRPTTPAARIRFDQLARRNG